MELEQIEKLEKSIWKALVKTKIGEWIVKLFNREIISKKKLRFLKVEESIKMEGHLKIINHEESRQIMRTRLNMVNVKANYRGSYKDYTCTGCHIHKNTTEHLFKCWKTVHLTGLRQIWSGSVMSIGMS